MEAIMKKLLLGSIALNVLLSATPVLAAKPAWDYKEGAPAVVNLPTWTGFYIGLNAGYGWGSQSIHETGDEFGGQDAINHGVIPASLANHPSGFVGGGQIGYNYQYRQVVFGLETDLQWARFKDSQTVSTSNITADGVIFFPFTTTAQQKVDYFGTVRARVGMTPIDPLLIYVTGGLAYGRVGVSASIVSPNNCVIGFCGSESTTKTNTGPVFGAGAEYAFACNWSARVEYLYLNLGKVSQTVFDAQFPGSGAFIAQSVRFRDNIVRAGVDYTFA